MSLVRLQITKHLIDLYKDIFPEVLASCPDDLGDPNHLIEQMNGLYENKAIWYGIINNNQIVGFCTVGLNGNHVHLYNVGIREEYRSKGYGTALMRSIIESYGSKNIFLFVRKNNRAAIKLYRKFGFEYVDNAYVPPKGEICYARYNSNQFTVVRQ
jgi:ribosomal protein S18 acetylase RimI-like enzyme